MKKKILTAILPLFAALMMTACGGNAEAQKQVETQVQAEIEVESAEVETQTQAEAEVQAETEAETQTQSEALLDAFLASEVPAFYDDGEGFLFKELPADENDYLSYYSVGERVDLDNDGEDEQIINGPYGGIYLDARDGKVYVLAEGAGTACALSYTHYDNVVWIVVSDTTHVGRQFYRLTKYDGEGKAADEFQLSAEYWDSPDDKYDENSDFTYRDEKISMEEYEALKQEIFNREQ